MKLNNLINIGARNVTLKYDLIFPMPWVASGGRGKLDFPVGARPLEHDAGY
jgi:hypothetical protein